MGTSEEIKKQYDYYKEKIKNLSKEDQIKWLEEIKWNIDMIDRWERQEYICVDAIYKLLNEIKENQ